MFDAPTMEILPSARLCRVHLFRHGEVEGPRGRVCRGQSDDPLSSTGLGQTQLVAAWARRNIPSPDRVISSDLSRCAVLARAIGPARLEPALREQDMGRWDGRTWEAITVEDPVGTLAYWGDYVGGKPHGGESFADVYQRATTWWDAQGFEGRVVVVTHIGVIRALLCHWLGLGPGEGLRWAPGYATHTEVLLADAGAVIERFGERVGT
jgi:alpha-ribazole phosphatase